MRGLNIPSCPAILSELNAELRKENCKQQRVVALISKDVALSAAVLKITNSASASTSRKITSIKDAITLLGTQNLVNFVVGDFLKRSLSIPKSKGLDRFWDKAAHNATVCGLLADRFRGVRRETAYCFGLFHDCGIPVMMQRYPDYKKTLQLASQSEQAFTVTEEAQHGTDHAIIGYLLARNWGLADTLGEAIRSHHEYEVLDTTTDLGISVEACTLIAISLISEHIVDLFLHQPEARGWPREVALITGFFGISQTELEDLMEDTLFQLQQQAV
jgi:HD-like signal output (HDOD) protein